MPKWLKILLGILAGLAAVIVVAVWIAFSATSGLIETIERQLTALKAGNIEAAYAETSDGFHQATSLEQFTAFVDQYPILKDADNHSFSSRSFENNDGQVSGTLVAKGGALTNAERALVYEKEAWKIHNIKLTGG
jgi:hypothetical protein